MKKYLFLNAEDRRPVQESGYRYKKSKPVTAVKTKRDEDGFFSPWAMFRPLACSGRSRGERESAAATTIQPGGAEPISTSPLFVCILRFFQENDAETAKNESEVRTDGRFHS